MPKEEMNAPDEHKMGNVELMPDDYYDQILAIIKKYNPSEYRDLMNNPYGGIVEDHLDAIIEQYPKIEDFEKAMKAATKEQKSV